MLYAEGNYILRRKVIVAHVGWRHLRDFVVLTVQATEIATRAGDREALGARMKVVKRFLLDGVDGQRTRLAIDYASEHTIFVAPTSTDACLAVCNMAMMRTEYALHLSIFQGPIVSAFH
jgi:hypothetical protein